MVAWHEVLILSLIQGLTEFLPVSSSAHLILVPGLLGWKDQGLAFDIAVHLGTLFAVLSYFRLDLIKLSREFINSCFRGEMTSGAKIVWSLGFATIPVGLLGLFGKHFIETSLRSPIIIAMTTIIFGILLYLMDRSGLQNRDLKTINFWDVMVIGFSQALSLVPGTSRSGITLTAGLFRGLTRESAARFSFLLSIPVIVLAGGLEALTLLKNSSPVDWQTLIMGISISALSGYFCIHYFLKILNKIGVLPFVIYRLFLGIFLIYYFS